MDRIDLAPGTSISRVIKGGWQLSSGHTPDVSTDDAQAFADMDAFREAGITTFDFGDIYRGVEELIGRYLSAARARTAGVLPAVQLHTKYVPDAATLARHSFQDVERIVDRSRARLGVDVLDLVQFHWWNYGEPRCTEAMLHLQTLQQQGKIRLLGVTNFDVTHMEEFVRAGVTPASTQVQYSLLDRRPEHGLIDFCAAHGIQLLCYGTVAGGFLSERFLGAPEPLPPYETRSMTKYKLIIDDAGGWSVFQELLSTLHGIARKHGTSISTVASAYIVQRPGVAAVIVGARTAAHVEDNAAITRLTLDASDRALIADQLTKLHDLPGDVYDLERTDPRHSGIMQTGNNAVPSH